MDQPLARLAFALLEPTSDDGVISWNVLDEWLGPGKDVPIYRIVPEQAAPALTKRPVRRPN